MSEFKLETSYSGVGEVFRSPETAQALKEIAESIASACGDGYASDVVILDRRAVASVYTDTKEAIKDNSDNNTLVRFL